MTLADLTSRDAVIKAMEEFDRLGRETFLAQYGFGEGLSYFIVWQGKRYDSKAIAGVAHGYQHPERGALQASEFSGGAQGAAGRLRQLGFEIDDVDTSAKVLQRFRGLRTSAMVVGGQSPHQALLSLIALRRLRRQGERLQPAIELAHELSGLLRRALPQVGTPSPWEPIWRMESSLWSVVGADGVDLRPEEAAPGRPPVSLLNDGAVRCGFTGSTFDVLVNDPELVARVEEMLLAEFLSSVPADVIADAMGRPRTGTSGSTHHLVVVHVPRASEVNFEFSEPRGTWGWKDYREHYSQIAPGDTILFALGFDGGSPRLSNEAFIVNSYTRVVVATVTSAITQYNTPFWPDETAGVVYPWRLSFTTVEDRRGSVAISSLDKEFDLEVGEALRMSATRQSQAQIAGKVLSPSPWPMGLDTVIKTFAGDLLDAGWDYGGTDHDAFVRRFVVSLAAKPFVILTGLSGSGKTQIALQFGRWLGAGRMAVVAVRPDWTSPEALLGYENGLSSVGPTGFAWHVPEALAFILRAAHDRERPYLLVLDEMNLAHVERYFADVLSGMESKSPIIPNLVHGADWRLAADQPQRLPLPSNLFVVGTVNVDETTYMFSPKVLDRANTIEFRVKSSDLAEGPRPRGLEPAVPELGRAFLTAAGVEFLAPGRGNLAEPLRELHGHLASFGMEFGHRTFAEALRYFDLTDMSGDHDELRALDVQIVQKVLPKFHGSIREMTGPLNCIGEWCLRGPNCTPSPSFDVTASGLPDPVLPLSFDKVQRMARRLRANHFVSFAE